MLSAAIFTTNPLSAMEKEENNKQFATHTCGACAEFNIPSSYEDNKNYQQHTQAFASFIDHGSSFLSSPEILHLSETSKTMYNLCQQWFLWYPLLENEREKSPLPLPSTLTFRCAKEGFKTLRLQSLNIFSNEDETYSLKASWLKSSLQNKWFLIGDWYRNETYPLKNVSWVTSSPKDLSQNRGFSIGQRNFALEWDNLNDVPGGTVLVFVKDHLGGFMARRTAFDRFLKGNITTYFWIKEIAQ